ncbi:sce7725 family protein [Hymenobacter arizonensis]|uniref:Sce7725 family protein n=1 Tax=Hymenobacter arizonensis TaxID=1227077 RepID=A0A1I5T837_HYMAR|nr:sce7725 family protein [Hymenobacter arizonensis]SFP78981.1 hypothetical protein SAMN04515668_0349 [Hymenobacter arizonensis]
MYLPYLRGKQFELLALRESINLMARKSDKISPIIEPVKKVSASLERCMADLANANINFSIILNPAVGELQKDYHVILNAIKSSIYGYENFQLAFLIDSEASWQRLAYIMQVVDFPFGGITLIHNLEFKDVKDRLKNVRNVKFNLINYGATSRRYHRNFSDSTKISLDDYFKSKARNSEYSKVEDEIFSDEYKFFSDEGFNGFSDYLTLGSVYSDAGFLPYAVAIHLTYLGPEEVIKVRHFVCDSTEDNTDTAGKFKEALHKLITWLYDNHHSTAAVEEFKQLHLNEHFPGLGIIKKLSIQNHLQLLLRLL